MKKTVIPPVRRFGIIVIGDVEVAREAVSKWVDPHRPMRNVHVNGYGNTHCDVFCYQEQLEKWSAASTKRNEHGQLLPGSLTFYLEKGY